MNQFLKSIIALTMVSAINLPSRSDEGMWLPFLIQDSLYNKMQLMGLELSRDKIFNLEQPSLKHAIVHFGGGCTAGIISDQGLLITNHHCGYSRIQAHSTPENDLLVNGFWAKSREEELPNPGLFVSFLVRVENVTGRIMKVINEQMTWRERREAINAEISRIVADATQDNHYIAHVRSMFADNEFYLFVSERFTDIRMVAAPPTSIGKFGGDTDNWRWPRHTGDFMLFRVYTGPDGKPAEYSPDNIPLTPRHYLPISVAGIDEGDFTMILGFPGTTDRFLTSMGIAYRLKYEFSPRIKIREKKLEIIEEAMQNCDKVRIKYASRQASISNHWKKFRGMKEALYSLPVAEAKSAQEARFKEWVHKDSNRIAEFGDVMKMFEKAYKGLKQFNSHNYYFLEAFRTGSQLITVGNSYRTLARLLAEDPGSEKTKTEIERLRNLLEVHYRNYDKQVDEQLWGAMLRVYNQGIPKDLQPQIMRTIEHQFRGDFDRFAREVYRRSIFADRQRLQAFLENPSYKKLKSDWVFRTAIALNDHNNTINDRMQLYNDILDQARHLYVRGLRYMEPERLFYPDANSTMRLTYGSVLGYSPADAVNFDYFTTLSGVMEKENPTDPEFIVPERLKELYTEGGFGAYGDNGQMVVNFISNNDITGGNSGSPVLDGQGNLVGLAFDGNWEALSGDIKFEPELQRTISVDARYILFIIDQFAGAGYLLDEMTIVE